MKEIPLEQWRTNLAFTCGVLGGVSLLSLPAAFVAGWWMTPTQRGSLILMLGISFLAGMPMGVLGWLTSYEHKTARVSEANLLSYGAQLRLRIGRRLGVMTTIVWSVVLLFVFLLYGSQARIR
jgi:hypothetical protein